MTAPFVDVVIACHDERRPIERAVRSVLAGLRERDEVRVTVVAHGVPAAGFEDRLSGTEGRWRVVEFADGIRSPAGPFNHGLSLAEGEYCAVMGSDDFLEPGAMSRWIDRVREGQPDAAIAPIRIDGQKIMPNPLTRLGRRRRMDAAKDRLFYRTAPLGLIRTQSMRRMGLRMTEGVRVGEDAEFGIRLFAQSERVDFLGGAGCYVIGIDASERTTHARMSLEESLEPIVRVLDGDLPGELTPSHRRALAIKLVRVSILGAARARADLADWRGDDEVRFLSDILRRLVGLAPQVLAPFNRHDRRVLDVLRDDPTVAAVVEVVCSTRQDGRIERWITPHPLWSFSRESMLRRYVLYVLKRERKTA